MNPAPNPSLLLLAESEPELASHMRSLLTPACRAELGIGEVWSLRSADAGRDQPEQPDPYGVREVGGCIHHVDLGLAGADYLGLCEQLRYVIAAPPSRGTDPNVARSQAVELAELARSAPNLRRLVVMSALCPGSGDLVLEDDEVKPERAVDPYCASALRMELSLRRAIAPQRLAIVRVGHRIERATPELLSMLLLLLENERLALVPPKTTLPLSPASLVATIAVLALSHQALTEPSDQQGQARAASFHAIDPNAPSVHELVHAIRKRLGEAQDPLRVAEVGRALLAGSRLGSVLRGPRALYDALFLGTRYDARHARALLDQRGHTLPDLDDYVDPLASAVLAPLGTRRRTLPPPPV